MALTKKDIVKGLKELGLPEGCAVMVHSALSAFGQVEGGAETVIEALLEAIGPQGTLMMPAMSFDSPFRIESSPSHVGLITEAFRNYPGVTRSLHPTHSVAGIGPLVAELIAGHIDQPTALGPESPWGRLAQRDDAYILFLGCDQDRNTLLHCAEEAVDAPYLNIISREYIDADGNLQTKILGKYPGPHRDFIGLDALFESAGIMSIGKIGSAVCRLTPAKPMLELTLAALRRDPAAVLCDNPHCRDCVIQRAAIKRDRLSREDFTLSAVIDDVGLAPEHADQALWLIAVEGIEHVEIGPQWARLIAEDDRLADELACALAQAAIVVSVYYADLPAASESSVQDALDEFERVLTDAAYFSPDYIKLPSYEPWERGDLEGQHRQVLDLLKAIVARAAETDTRLLIENVPGSFFEDGESCDRALAHVASSPQTLFFSFNPAHFVQVGEKPFLYTFRQAKAKRRMAQLMISDGCEPPWPKCTFVGQGQGEVKELMSILRCRSFSGYFTIALGDIRSPDNFTRQAKAFWHLLDNM